MGRTSQAAGFVAIRQVYTRVGKPVFCITLPMALMEHLGWQGGQYLSYFPTTGKELVLVLRGQLLSHVSPDYDVGSEPLPQASIGPRPGSLYARQLEMEGVMNKKIEELSESERAFDQMQAGKLEKRKNRLIKQVSSIDDEGTDGAGPAFAKASSSNPLTSGQPSRRQRETAEEQTRSRPLRQRKTRHARLISRG